MEKVSYRGAVHKWRMRIACWIPQSTNKHSGFSNANFFLTVTIFEEGASLLRCSTLLRYSTLLGYSTFPLLFYVIPHNSSKKRAGSTEKNCLTGVTH